MSAKKGWGRGGGIKEVSGMDRGLAYIIQASILGDLLEVANCFVLRGRYEFGLLHT